MIKHISGGGSSYADALKKSALHIDVRPSRERCLYVISDAPSFASLSESAEDEDNAEVDVDEFKKYLFEGRRGGSIVFSTEVNSAMISSDPIKSWILKKFYSMKNKFSVKSFLRRLRDEKRIKAWTIGQYFIGSYTGDDGRRYDEKSMTLDMIDVDREVLFSVAEEICKFLKQESVLVKDSSNNQIYFVIAK